MKINIGMTAWRRPEYFTQVIAGLRRCPEVLDHQCLVSVDGGHPDLQALHKRVFDESGLRGDIILHKEKLGCAANTGWVFQHSFTDGADAVIMLEDDTVPARDYLHYMRAMLERFVNDEKVFDVSGYHRRVYADSPVLAKPGPRPAADGMVKVTINLAQSTRLPPAGPGRKDAFFFRDRFYPWGWGTWRRIREEIGEDWFGAFELPGSNVSMHDLPYGPAFREQTRVAPDGVWDVPMEKFWRRGRIEAVPDVSRIQNIGAEKGTFCPGGNFHRHNQHTEIWMDDETYEGEFVQIDPPLPS